MRPHVQRYVISALLIGLVVGLVVGIVINEVLPGASVDENANSNDARADENKYYLIDLETAETWLTEYVDTAYAEASEKPNVSEHFNAINQIANADENFIKTTEGTGEQLHDVLGWSQAALNGITTLNESQALTEQLPKDRKITTCLALNADPWNTDPNFVAGVELYVVVPEGEDKNLPKDWTEVPPKNEFDIGWTPLLCDPGPDAS